MPDDKRSETGRLGSSSEQEFLDRLTKALPKLTEQARADFDRFRDPHHDHKKKALEIGLFGRLVGDSAHAPNNIVGMIIVICAVMLLPIIISVCVRETTSAIVSGLAITLLTTMTTSAGYLFGRSSLPTIPPNTTARTTTARSFKGG